eukprot:TRINITY_DN12319_c0_g1_i1.p1 TRINITY_DN12319_c0_g1~~TRINITY_DN12319_c0_g1_i1.p1  ORF type:complete len:147 (+),score=39.39 TRINITY_DN12319_c0_g1_i1:21-461(+)
MQNIGVTDLEIFTEVLRKQSLKIMNLNDFMVELRLSSSSSGIHISAQKVVLSPKKKVELTIELTQKITKPECIILSMLGGEETHPIMVQQKAEFSVNLVSMLPFMFGLCIMEYVIRPLLDMEERHTMLFLFGAAVMAIQWWWCTKK